MKTDRQIFVLPLILLAILLLVLGGLYYYASGNTAYPEGDDTATTTTTSYQTTSTVNSQNSYLTDNAQVGNSGSQDVAQVSNQGVLPERLGWQTFTDADYSYALSYPQDWHLVGGSALASMTDGSASVSVQSFNIAPNTTPSLFASENGASGFESIAVNAYDAVEAFQGSNTVYFIVNGSVGYKITVPNNANENDANVVRAMLLTFTVTKAR